MNKLPPEVVGDSVSYTFTGTDSAGEPESITGDTITFRAFDDAGNEIVRAVGDGITLATQSGDTLGQAVITIAPGDWPAAWLAIEFGHSRRLNVEVERITAAGETRTPEQRVWMIWGQGIA